MSKVTEKKEKPIPKKCVCGKEAVFVKTRAGKMFTCPAPLNCKGNLRTAWKKSLDLAVLEWNDQVDSFYAKSKRR